MVQRKTWEEFRETKLLWWVNRSLHIFGWAIVIEVDPSGAITGAFPARVKFRGFDEGHEADGFNGLTQYLKETVDELVEEAQ